MRRAWRPTTREEMLLERRKFSYSPTAAWPPGLVLKPESSQADETRTRIAPQPGTRTSIVWYSYVERGKRLYYRDRLATDA